MDDEFRWSEQPPVDLYDGLTTRGVVEALYAPDSLRLDNRMPPDAATLLIVCAPTEDLRLIVVICLRAVAAGAWTIVAAREAKPNERAMWGKYTS